MIESFAGKDFCSENYNIGSFFKTENTQVAIETM